MRTVLFSFFIGLISGFPQYQDHPQKALEQLRAQFVQEQQTSDYPRMLGLMDKILQTERSIDYRAAAKVRTEFETYAPLFQKSAEGRAVYRLYMQQIGSSAYARDVVVALQPDKDSLMRLPCDAYKDILRPGYQSPYPCANLYEAALFIQLDQQPDSTLYIAFDRLYEAREGNFPAHWIFTQLHRWRYGDITQSQRLRKIDSLIGRYADREPVTLAVIDKAQILMEYGRSEVNRQKAETLFEQVRTLCKRTLATFPSSPQKKQLKNMVETLESPQFSFTIKGQIHPQAPLEVVVEYTNIARVNVKITDPKGHRIAVKKFAPLEAPLYVSVTDTFTLPTPAEGHYRVQVKHRKNLQYADFYIGKVAAMFRGYRERGYVYAVDGYTGKPFPKIDLTFPPNPDDNPANQPLLPSLSLTQDGFTQIPWTRAHSDKLQRNGLRMRVVLPATEGSPCDSFSAPLAINRWDLGSLSDPAREHTAVSLFTDRKLYQPTDSIYFKGIMTAYSQGQTHTVAGQKVSVFLSSQTSRQDTLARLDCITNEYGSFSGSFATGKHLMNGMYRIYTSQASVGVRIEQYVRPSFTVEMSAPETVLAFGDAYTQKGRVQNNAGFPLADAVIEYTVTRAPLVRPYLGRYVPYYDEETEIARGMLQSNAQGDFEITFDTPRPVTDSKALCVFRITVKVSDPSGETHTAQLGVSVGDNPIVYQASVPSAAVREQFPVLDIKALNLNGKEQAIRVPFSLHLQGRKVFEGVTENGITPQPQWDSLPSGAYTLRYGTQDSLQFTLFGLQDTESPVPDPVFFYPVEGATPSFMLGTREPRIYLLASFYDGDSLCLQQVIEHSRGLHRYSFPAMANYPEPLLLQTVTVWHGDCLTHSHTFTPPLQPPLDLTLASFRNTALPDSETSFALQLKPRIPAELLLSVYNASTDRLGTNNFSWYPARGYKPSPRPLRKQFDESLSGRSVAERYYVYAQDEETMMMVDGRVKNRTYATAGPMVSAKAAAEGEAVTEGQPDVTESPAAAPGASDGAGEFSEPVVRTDFAETLAFLPHLQAADSSGLFPVRFRTNGLLSTFRVLAMAHTRDGRNVQLRESLTVRKEVMVMPSFPAFLREGDSIDFGAKAVNLTSGDLKASAYVSVNGEPLDTLTLQLPAAGQQQLYWPYGTKKAADPAQPCHLVLLAQLQSPLHSDAQQNEIPVLSRRQQVVRAQTLLLKAGGMKTLHPLSDRSTLQCEATTPIVAALSALPALTRPEGDNLLSWLAAYFAWATGERLLRENPQLVQWIESLPQGQASALQHKEDITEIYLEETPWLAYRQTESNRMRSLLALTDTVAVQQMLAQAWNKFAALQQGNGGFAWFPGMGASYSLTLCFLEQMGDLAGYPVAAKSRQIMEKAVHYADLQFAARYPLEVRKKLKKGEIPYEAALFLYVRSAFADLPYATQARELVDFFAPYVDRAWEGKSVMDKAYWAMTYRRLGHTAALDAVKSSLREYAVESETMGCFFPNAVGRTGLMSSQMRAHALLLQLFADRASLRTGLQQWILLQKKNHIWDNGPSTARVITALIETGALQVPHYELIPSGRSFIVKNRSNTPLFASLYEQTLQDVDTVEAFSNELGVTRSFYRNGQLLQRGDVLRPGERLTVRYVIDNTQDRSFVHLQALRAACLVPVNETSSYAWGGTCGYYREIKASATNFFFQELTSGVHTLEEDFYVTQSGVFSDGWAKVQCLYAPEYRGHSTGGTLHSRKGVSR